jgi:hypothetical protein
MRWASAHIVAVAPNSTFSIDRLQGGVEDRLDGLHGAEAALAYHPGLPAHPGGLDHVPVGLPVLDLPTQERRPDPEGTTQISTTLGISS